MHNAPMNSPTPAMTSGRYQHALVYGRSPESPVTTGRLSRPVRQDRCPTGLFHFPGRPVTTRI